MRKSKAKAEKIPVVTVYTSDDWRTWLAKNHLKEKKVAMVSHKKHTGKPFLSHRTAMEEAICFGWIDTTIKRLDEDKFVRYFVRRGDHANWSINTLRYAKDLLAAGKMAPAGISRYKEGLRKKPHDHGLPTRPDMPAGLKKALATKKAALENFEEFPPSAKYAFYRWILRAKGDDTKARRIDAVVKRALVKDKSMV